MKTFYYFFFLLSLLVAPNLSAQTTPTPWSLELHYTPQSVDYHAPQRGNFLPAESTLTPGYSFTLGLGVYRQLNARISLSSGLAFCSIVSESLDQELRWGSEHDGNGGFGGPDPNNPNQLSFQEHLYFLQLPLQVQLYLSTGKWRCYTKTGIQLEHLLARRTAAQQSYGNGKVLTTHTSGEDDALRPLNVLANVGFGIEWTRQSRQSFFLEPEARLTLLGVAANVPFPTRRYDLGLRTGMRLRFAKA